MPHDDFQNAPEWFRINNSIASLGPVSNFHSPPSASVLTSTTTQTPSTSTTSTTTISSWPTSTPPPRPFPRATETTSPSSIASATTSTLERLNSNNSITTQLIPTLSSSRLSSSSRSSRTAVFLASNSSSTSSVREIYQNHVNRPVRLRRRQVYNPISKPNKKLDLTLKNVPGLATPPPKKNFNILNWIMRSQGQFSKLDLPSWNSVNGRALCNRSLIRGYVSSKQPSLFKENILPLVDTDKIFCSTWLSEDEIVCGTKCNKLFIYNLDKKRRVNVPLLSEPDQPEMTGAGNHSVAINKSQSLIATGGSSCNDVSIYALPKFKPVYLGKKHEDWIFSIQWINDLSFVTGSRDQHLGIWHLENMDDFNVEDFESDLDGNDYKHHNYVLNNSIKPTMFHSYHQSKVRDLQFNENMKQLGLMFSDTSFKILDTTTFKPILELSPYLKESFCVDYDYLHNQYILGSVKGLSFIDARVGTLTKTIRCVNESWGVRSLSMNENVVTVGGGCGKLSFYDNRSRSHVILPTFNGVYYECGKGWLKKNETFVNHFREENISNAIYTNCYSPSKSKLLAAGGPAQYCLNGCYAAIWG